MRKKIPSIIALFCIVVYTASVVFAAYRIYRGIERQKETAGAELNGIAGLISQNVFFEENGGNLIQERIRNSEALEGIIITGSAGNELAFEREPGKIIVTEKGAPGFARRLGISYLPAKQVDVQGLRNVNIYSAYNTVNYTLFVETLKQSLAAILAALLVAFLTLIISSTLRKEKTESPEETRNPESPETTEQIQNPAQTEPAYQEEEYDEEDLEDDFDFTDFSEPENDGTFAEAEDTPAEDHYDDYGPSDSDEAGGNNDSGGFDDFALDDFLDEDTLTMPGEETPAETDAGISAKTEPQGLYSPKSGIGWESYMLDRLASQIHRCAASEQDLVVALFECGESIAWDDECYKKFAGEAVQFFNLKDLTFEKGSRGISVIIPNTDLDRGIAGAEEFHARVLKTLPGSFTAKSDLRAGLSSRSGRLIDADRLFFEASSALEKAKGGQPIVAFKSNPEKYREFIRKSQV
jgi:hypothetical protein